MTYINSARCVYLCKVDTISTKTCFRCGQKDLAKLCPQLQDNTANDTHIVTSVVDTLAT